MTKNFINASRSSHWLKLLFTAAFLDTRSNVRGASGNFDTVVFVDADSIVRLPEWNLKAFVDLTMTRSHKTLVLSEDRSYDFISTGEIFAKSPIKDFLWTWYKHAPDYYGEYTSPNETYASGLHVSNLPQKGTNLSQEGTSFLCFSDPIIVGTPHEGSRLGGGGCAGSQRTRQRTRPRAFPLVRRLRAWALWPRRFFSPI